MRNLFVFTITVFFLAPSTGGWGQSYDELYDLYLAAEYETVITALDEPNDGKQWMLRADALQKTGRLEDALNAYYMAEVEGYLKPDLLLHRAICQVSMQSFSSAREDLERASMMDDAEPRIPYYFAAISYAENDFSTCFNYIDEALRIKPDYFDATYLKGAALYEMNKLKDAEKAFRDCLEIIPNDERALLCLSMCIMEQLKFGQALDALDVLINSEDENIARDAYYQRGVCRYQLREYSGACEDWANAADLGDEDARELSGTVCNSKRKKKINPRKGVYVAF